MHIYKSLKVYLLRVMEEPMEGGERLKDDVELVQEETTPVNCESPKLEIFLMQCLIHLSLTLYD